MLKKMSLYSFGIVSIIRIVNRVGFFLLFLKNILFENKKFQLEMIILENFSNLIRENMIICLYLHKILK